MAGDAASGNYTAASLARRLRELDAAQQARGGEAAEDVGLQLGHPEQQEWNSIECPLPDFLDRVSDEAWLKQFGRDLPYFAETSIPLLSEEPAVLEMTRQMLPEGSVAFASDESSAGCGKRLTTLQFFWWIGPGGVRSGLHSDPYPVNVLYILHGQKTVWIFRPGDADKLYPNWKFDYGATIAGVDPFQPNLTRYPRFAETQPLVAQLKAGDALLIPPGWFHYAEADTATVGVTARTFTTCEILSFWDVLALGSMKNFGLFTPLGLDSTDFATVFSRNRTNPCATSSSRV